MTNLTLVTFLAQIKILGPVALTKLCALIEGYGTPKRSNVKSGSFSSVACSAETTGFFLRIISSQISFVFDPWRGSTFESRALAC